ncbi:hypothetical protein ACFPIJ_48035 [Dactylosporangium cerinum]|uniref:Uncharacterized protein n=1 Tax=Dactylosporangium cerinum TaxID=1434730 RepID=A0ABV9WAU4_9ACTN
MGAPQEPEKPAFALPGAAPEAPASAPPAAVPQQPAPAPKPAFALPPDPAGAPQPPVAVPPQPSGAGAREQPGVAALAPPAPLAQPDQAQAPFVPLPQTPDTATAATRSGGLHKGWLWAFVALVVVVCGVSCYGSLGDSGTGVDVPVAADQQSVVDGLARATAAHGVCYGWRLQTSTSTVNVGSNLGVGKAVTDDPAKCAKYVEVQANVRYYPESSESEDSATYTIRSTLGDSGRLDPAAFDRLGAGTGKLLDDPSTTILVAADALPLLTQEAGLAPTPVPVPAATGSVAPVATGGSDFLRDRWVLLSVAGGLLLVAAVALLLGIRSSRRPAP